MASNECRTGTGPIGDQTPGGRPGTGSNPLGPRGSGPLGVHLSVHWKGRQGSYEGDGGGIVPEGLWSDWFPWQSEGIGLGKVWEVRQSLVSGCE